MSHEIEFNKFKQTHSMFSVKEVPWHGLGQIVDNALTAKDAIEAANLDFTVVKRPNYIKIGNTEIVNPYSWGTARTDNNAVLGSVGSDYTILQNDEVFSFFDSIVGEGKAIFQTAGVLGIGQQIFITAKLPKSIVVNNIDVIDQYLVLSNSHDGSRSIEVLFTPIRVVCSNTLQAALSSAKNRVRIRHTKSAHDKLKLAANLLGVHSNLMENQNTIYNRLAEKTIDDGKFKEYITNVFLTDAELKELANIGGVGNIHNMEKLSTNKKNILNTVSKYYVAGPGQDMKGVANTMWTAYNAVTGYYQNVKNYTKVDDKMNKLYYGGVFNKMNKALNVAYNMS